jgi:hypothetical protein
MKIFRTIVKLNIYRDEVYDEDERQVRPTFAGPSLIFFIWSLYLTSSESNRLIFLSIDSARLSTYRLIVLN